MRLEGGCYCGEVRYVAEGDPMMQAQCHCRECQYISGGAPNTFIAMPAAGFSYITGQPKQFTRKDLERAVTREFCAECGTHLVTKVPGLPAAILKVGTLDEPAQFHPQMAIYTRHAGVPRDPGGHEDIREAAGALGAPISGNSSCPGLPRLRGRSPLRRGEGPGMNVLGYGRMGRGWPGQARP
ncbi:GFA family protein [Bradyrhizobium barranii subsp. apii]|uniref:GFA family protein n=1 Tax=Bradyrhizobium barranii subsp. apii TaxID=2819348 RepID=A0A8U0FM26_9BRAD|nr:GFA family protein [Bradyrhizobium barranii subsp. apii]